MAYRYTIVAGPHGRAFAEELAKATGAELLLAEHKVFPDGELYYRLPKPVETAVAVVTVTMYPGQNDALVEALLLVEASLGAGAKSAVVLAPYLAYSRQDRRFLEGEPISVRAVLRALHAAGARGFVTVDIHKEASLAEFPGVAVNVDPSPAVADYLKLIGYVGDDVVVVGPDKGAALRARRVADRIGAAYDYLEKFRDRVTGEVTYRPREVDVRGRRVVLVDDIISTGGTIAKSASMLYEQGAREVIAVCTHGLFVGEALDKLRKAGIKRIAAANTVPVAAEGVEVINVAPLVARYIDYVVERL